MKMLIATDGSDFSEAVADSRRRRLHSTITDQCDADLIFLHYGIWNEELYRLQKGTLWSWAKEIHEPFWLARHN